MKHERLRRRTSDAHPGPVNAAHLGPCVDRVRARPGRGLVLGDAALATTISTIFIGIVAIGVGAFEIAHVVWTKGWGGYVWQAGLGLIHIGLGFVLVSPPASGAIIVAYMMGLLFLLSGVFRILFSISHWNEVGLIMFLAGLALQLQLPLKVSLVSAPPR